MEEEVAMAVGDGARIGLASFASHALPLTRASRISTIGLSGACKKFKERFVFHVRIEHPTVYELAASRFRYVGQRARAVKGMHSKCIGLCPREFESHRCRFCHSFRGQKLCPGHPLGPFFDEDSDFQLHFG